MSTDSQVNTFPWQSCNTDHQNFLWEAASSRNLQNLTWFASLTLGNAPQNNKHTEDTGWQQVESYFQSQSILYRLPSTGEASVFIFHNVHASV